MYECTSLPSSCTISPCPGPLRRSSNHRGHALHNAGSLRNLTINIMLAKLPLFPGQSESFRLAALENLEVRGLSCDYNSQALIGFFPPLQKMVLNVTISSVTLSEPSALTSVLYTHQENLWSGNFLHFKHWKSAYPRSYPIARLSISSIVPQAPCLVSLRMVDFVPNDVLVVEAILEPLPLRSDGEKCLQ